MEKLYNEFLCIATVLNRRFDIAPVLFGSLGLQVVTEVEFNPQDIDILVPKEYVRQKWELLRGVMEEMGYTFVDIDEHEFEKHGIKIAFAFEEDLAPFAGVDYINLEVVRDQEDRYKMLSVEDYLKVYSKSVLDGYRSANNSHKDNHKIEVLHEILKISSKY